MWFWLISSIAGSILGSAADSWFADTKLGKWVYKKVDQVAGWSASKLGIKILQDENNWRNKYPNIANKMDDLETRLSKLERGNKDGMDSREIYGTTFMGRRHARCRRRYWVVLFSNHTNEHYLLGCYRMGCNYHDEVRKVVMRYGF